MPPAPPSASAPVVIAIDPHKASWTAVAVDNRLQPLAAIRVEVNRAGYRQLRRFAGRWPHATWAVEGATGLGAALTAKLTADHIDVVDVPAKLARRVRMQGYAPPPAVARSPCWSPATLAVARGPVRPPLVWLYRPGRSGSDSG